MVLSGGIDMGLPDDCVSREAVLLINELHYGQMPNHINHQIWQEIKDLPSVTPKPKTGHWIDKYILRQYFQYECSECGRASLKSNFCPKCGAKMESEVSK